MKDRLRELLKNSYSPVYNYPVAAIVECKDGQTFEGVNVETSSPASGVCAERNALYSAISQGYKKEDIEAIYIMNKSDNICFPCFVCRQALNDLCSEDTLIVSFNYKGDKSTSVTVKDLCPFSFGTNDINVK